MNFLNVTSDAYPIMFQTQISSVVCQLNFIGDQLVSSLLYGISVPPVVISGTTIQSYSRGDTMYLNCSANIGSINSIQWLKNGINLVNETSVNLQITTLAASDGGEYTCVANITDRIANNSVTIYIQPEFTMQPSDVRVSNGSTATMTCEASAYPSPAYVWEKADRQPIRSGVMTNSSTLVLDYVLFGDEGYYYCNATSGGITVQSETATVTGNYMS